MEYSSKYYAVFEWLEETFPDLGYYLLGRLATAVADFEIPQERILFWIDRSRFSTRPTSYLTRCLENELKKRGRSMAELDRIRTARQTNMFICYR